MLYSKRIRGAGGKGSAIDALKLTEAEEALRASLFKRLQCVVMIRNDELKLVVR